MGTVTNSIQPRGSSTLLELHQIFVVDGASSFALNYEGHTWTGYTSDRGSAEMGCTDLKWQHSGVWRKILRDLGASCEDLYEIEVVEM